MAFFIFAPCGFYLDCGFSKVPGDVFIRKIFHFLPLWFFRYHSTTSNPCGFYSDRGFAKVTGGAFIRGEVFISPPVGFIQTVVFTTLPATFLFRPLLQSGREEYRATEGHLKAPR